MSEQVVKKYRKTPQQQWREVLESRGVKQTWLAGQTKISPEHISNILAGRVLLTDENRKKINGVLGTDF
jgi:plasmid maintenance system antidote protein VapI